MDFKKLFLQYKSKHLTSRKISINLLWYVKERLLSSYFKSDGGKIIYIYKIIIIIIIIIII